MDNKLKRTIDRKTECLEKVSINTEEVKDLHLYTDYTREYISNYPRLSEFIKTLQNMLEKYGDIYVCNASNEYTDEINSIEITKQTTTAIFIEDNSKEVLSENMFLCI